MAMAAALVVFLLAAGVGRSESAVYKVGDAVGWTILGSPNYTAWSLSKNFKMGDTIVFDYSKNIHNVLERVDIQVSKPSSSAAPSTSTSAPAYPPSRVGSSSGGISTPAAAPRSSSRPRCVAKVFVIGLAVFSFAAVSVCGSSGRSTATPPVEVAVMVPATEGSGMVRRRADAPLRRRRPRRRSRLRCRRRRRMAPLPPHGVAAGNQGMTHASLPVAVHEKEKERE
ncbi:unnamed protein product [Musa acuminata subsp. burmannicoides]